MKTPGHISTSDIQHPRLIDLFEFWNAKRGEAAVPRRADIDVLDLAPWFGNLMLLDVIDGGTAFFYRVYGTHLVRLIQHDLTNKCTADLKPGVRETVEAEYRSVIAAAAPHHIGHRRTVVNGTANVSKLVLPLTREGAGVDQLLCGVYVNEMMSAKSAAPQPGGLMLARAVADGARLQRKALGG